MSILSQSVIARSFEWIQKSTWKSDTYLHVCYNPGVLRANEVATQELSELRHMTPWPRRAEAVGVCSVIETKQMISPAKFWKRNRGEKGAWTRWRIQLHLTATWVSCEIPEKLLPRATLICRLELPASSWTVEGWFLVKELREIKGFSGFLKLFYREKLIFFLWDASFYFYALWKIWK